MNQKNMPFSAKADAYAKGRPGYPDAALSFLKQKGIGSGARIADIGAGTGLFSKALLTTGAEVFAVEPDDAMRAKAAAALSVFPLFHEIAGSAEQIPLPDGSMNFVSAAQAFHWFDKDSFKRECRRILMPGGKIVLIWNVEVFGSDFLKDLGEVLKKHTYMAGQTKEEAGYSVEDYFFKPAEAFLDTFERAEFPNDLVLDRETFIFKFLSSSAAPAAGDERYAAFTAGLEQVFERYQKNGALSYPNKTVLYFGETAL